MPLSLTPPLPLLPAAPQQAADLLDDLGIELAGGEEPEALLAAELVVASCHRVGNTNLQALGLLVWIH